MEKKIFISYSSQEMGIAGQVCEYLENNGLSCWIAPRNVNPGDNYATQIVRAIRESTLLVLLASESTNASGHVSNEVSLAFDSKKPIIPFKIEDISFSDEYLYFLGRKHWIEAHRDMKLGLEQLLKTVNSLLGEERGLQSLAQPLSSMPPTWEKPLEITREQELEFDKVQEKIEKDYSREEIIANILEHGKKYAGKRFNRFENEDFEELKKYANEFMKQAFTVYRYNERKEIENCIDYLVEELIGDDDSEVIKLSGQIGCGKSILMQMAFYKTLKIFERGETKFLPFYISLGYFEEARYSDDSIYDQVKVLMEKEMVEFLVFAEKNPDVTPVLFIDEVRQHNMGKIALENVLMDVLKEHNIYKRVVSLDTGLITMRGKVKRVIPIISEKVSALFEVNIIETDNETKALEFIENVLLFYGYNIEAMAVLEMLRKLKHIEIDVFIVSAIAEEMTSSQEEIENLSDVYEKWALTILYGDEDKLREIAKSAHDYIFSRELKAEDITFNNAQWSLIHTHRTYLEFLIAYHMIITLEDDGEEYEFLKIMLTSSTDGFIRAFLVDNYPLQEKIFNIITSNYEAFGIVQKSSAVFWLAKITYRNLVADTVRFLRKIFDEMKLRVKKNDNLSQENCEEQFFFRAVCFALIAHGQTGILDDYLCLLITNDSANAINRGAIIEYHSEQYQMAENDSYYLDTDVKRGAKAINYLSWRVKKTLRQGSSASIERELLTLCMLLQRRIESNSSINIPRLREWVIGAVASIKAYKSHPQNINSEKIEFFFDSVLEDFQIYLHSEEGFDISQHIYNSLGNLKEVKRKQWLEKGIEDPESISEHIFSTWTIAMLFLPEEMERDDYSKREVMDMLLIHDMAEATMGDQVTSLNEPSKELGEQNKIMRKLMVKGTYPNIANLTHYYNVWTGYYKGLNINAKIARDINLVQTVYTFFEYYDRYPENFTSEDKSKWLNEKNNIETEIGYVIFEKLIEKNLSFEIRKTESTPEIEISSVNSEERYTVVGYQDLSAKGMDMPFVKQELLRIINNVNSMIPAETNTGLETTLDMLDKITQNWRLLLNEKNEIVGYWVFVALQKAYYDRAKLGQLDEEEIVLDTIEFINFPGTYKGYLLMSGSKAEVRTAALVQKVYESLTLHIQRLAEEGIFFDEIAALVESPMGKSALQKMGFIPGEKHKVAGTMYQCDLTNIDTNPYFSSFDKIVSVYRKYFEKD